MDKLTFNNIKYRYANFYPHYGIYKGMIVIRFRV